MTSAICSSVRTLGLPMLMARYCSSATYSRLQARPRPWTETGAFSCDELPEILRILDEEARKDKERLAQIEAERERKLRESTYDEELRMREEEKEEKRNSVEKINFFQRVVPLQSMIKRAIKHGDAIMWGRP